MTTDTKPMAIKSWEVLGILSGHATQIWRREPFTHGVKIGTRLLVREALNKHEWFGARYAADGEIAQGVNWRWPMIKHIPSFQMPKEAYRLALIVTEIEHGRLLPSITDEECEALGITKEWVVTGANCNGGVHCEEHGFRWFMPNQDEGFETPQEAVIDEFGPSWEFPRPMSRIAFTVEHITASEAAAL